MCKTLGVLLFVILFLGCVTQNPESTENTLKVIVTILPQAEFVQKIGGDKVTVTTMVPPGASPHVYEPTPSQLTAVSKASVYMKVGSGIQFEQVWLQKIVDINKDMEMVDCSEGVDLIITGDNGRYDPHIWLSPKNAIIMVENMCEGLIAVDPGNADYYTRNKIQYIEKLTELDRDIRNVLTGVKPRKILVYHPSWAYFCRDYDLEQIPIEEEGKEPTPRGIAELIEQAKKYNITVVFASPQFSTETAEIIAQEINGTVLLIDPLAENYIDNMRTIAEKIAEV
jgi:zinc transport system substrate-binding protein